MTKEEISKFAYMDKMPEADMTCPERCLWYELRDIYRQFRSGKLTKEKGDSEKNAAIRRYELETNKAELAKRILKRQADMWTEIELAGNMYGMDRTLENADALLAAVYGVKRKNASDNTGKAGDSV